MCNAAKKRKGIIKVDWSLEFQVVVVPQHQMNTSVCKTYLFDIAASLERLRSYSLELAKLSRDCEDFSDQKDSWRWGSSRKGRATQLREYSNEAGLSAEIWDQFNGTFCICAYTHLSRTCKDLKLQLLGVAGESICQIILGLLQEDEGLMGRVKFHEMS